MDVTADVITDLLPASYSGEASAATKALVEEFFVRDPAFAERARRDWASPLGAPAPPSPAARTAGVKSLQRTQRLLRMQRWLFAFALTFTLMPLSVIIPIRGGRPQGVHFLLRDYPSALLPGMIAAAMFWGLYATMRRRVRV